MCCKTGQLNTVMQNNIQYKVYEKYFKISNKKKRQSYLKISNGTGGEGRALQTVDVRWRWVPPPNISD